MAQDSKIGDNGFGYEDTSKSQLYAKYTSYRGYLELGYSHKEALRIAGLSEEEYVQLSNEYEIITEDEE